jgi:hypothetical protein
MEGVMKYSEKLKDPRWQKKRLEVLQRDEFMCVTCQNTEEMLCVHHLDYIKGIEPWDYPIECLVTLCKSCHDYEYETRPSYEAMLLNILKLRGYMADDLYSFVSGLNALEMEYPPDVMAKFIEFILSNSVAREVCWDLYWAYIEEKAGVVKKNG